MPNLLAPTGVVAAADCAKREFVTLQPSKGAFRAPLPAYFGQDLTAVASRLPQFRAAIGAQPLVPPVRLDLITLHNGSIAIGNNADGLIVDEGGRVVRETAMFTGWQSQQPIDLPRGEAVLDDIFVGFDGAWSNWYHWLCFALGRSAIAAGVLGTETRIVLPAYASRRPAGFSEAAWTQSLEAFGFGGRVQFLPRGLFRAKTIRLLWTTPNEPTNLTYLDAFHEVFARVRRSLRLRPDLPRRLLLSRGRSGNPRISVEETALVEEAASRHGFVPLHLETLDFRGQAEALFNAECVLGVHGAGMANILFGRDTLRVLELNLKLDRESLLRPWFYLLAYARRQKYMMLDRDAGDLSQERLNTAIETLLTSR